MSAKKITAKKTANKKKASGSVAVQPKASPKTAASKTSTVKKPAAAAQSAPLAAVKKGPEGVAPRAVSALSGFKKFTPYEETKGEIYMNERQVEHFRNILRSWKQELMEEVDRTVHHMQDEAANFPDPNDRASQEADFTMELRTRDRERKLIKKIDEAIRALEARDYGYCEVCGVEIGIRRLEARPTATLCIDCKTLDEIRERQMG